MLECTNDKQCPEYYSKEEVDGECEMGEADVITSTTHSITVVETIERKPTGEMLTLNRKMYLGKNLLVDEKLVPVMAGVGNQIVREIINTVQGVVVIPNESDFDPVAVLKEIRRILDDPTRNVHAIHRISELLMKYNI
mgnify:FL=1|jgi:hypothetical protein